MMCDNCGWSRAENKCDNCEQMQLARQLIRERDTAFARGAEAMREAAAQLFDGKPTVPGLATMPPYAEAIRALPIPDDKSSEG